MSFVHLHVHSQYSLLEATCRMKDLANRAADYGMPAVAITDNGNLFGCIEFYFAAQAAGVKPIIGLEVIIAPGSRHDRGEAVTQMKMPNRRLVLLAQNFEGYQNLCKLSSSGYKEGFYYRPRVDYEVLNKYSENVIALSGGLGGEVPWHFLNRGADAALEKVQDFKKIYGDRFYLELNRTGRSEWDQVNPFLLEAAEKCNIETVAANDVHYVESKDQLAQEVLICIGSNKTLQDESRYRLGSDQFYFKNPESMRTLFKDQEAACDRTLEIAERCNIKFNLKDEKGQQIYHLPSYPTEANNSLKDEMARLSFEGLEARKKEAAARKEPIPEERYGEYEARLEYELGVIEGMGFNGYFLIVQDFIGWAKENGIPVGPGRGSGAGSLVAYCLGITDLDPMPYNLIFERFLNPERISMPDFDIDFCQENRQRVIEYVTNKYGEASVSQIITYGKLQARAAIRDVGRVMGLTYGDVDIVAKLIPDRLGIDLKASIEEEPRLAELMEVDPKVNTLMDLAQKIEGLVRHAGIHAAGVVIADGAIVSHAPLYRGVEGENVVQYDMKHAEKIGLIKFDFLGLKTLTHINEALKLIQKNRQKTISTSEISLSDEGIYEIMCAGDTAGIFQFEGEGITDLIRKARPSCFEDIVAINALYRPGPMDMIPEYLRRKHGEVKVEYLFDELEDILRETYGIVVYQEQVQLIAAKIANYSLGEADMLRRAMGKKIAEEMAVQKKRFMDGAKENQFDAKKSEELFDTMAEFAKYGFNKSHAAAYCVVAAQTAYLKNYYPVEFFAALLSTEMNDTDKVVKYVKDAQKHNIEVKAPHINYSEWKFTVKGDEIFFSLGAIKGVGQAAVEALIEARSLQPDLKFTSLEHFFGAIDLRRVNKKTIECLIKSGAMDDFAANRNELLSGYQKFIDRADQAKRDREVGQVSLFDMSEDTQQEEKVVLDKMEPLSRSRRLAFEKEVLGFFLSDHPLAGYDDIAKMWDSTAVINLSEKEHKSQVQLLVMVSTFKEIITKKGTRMAFCQIEDLTDSIELIVFPNTYATCEATIKSESVVLVTGTLEKDEGSMKVIAENIQLFDKQLNKIRKLTLKISPEMAKKMEDIKQVLNRYPGEAQVGMDMRLPELSKVVHLNLKDPKGVQPSQDLFESLNSLFGDTRYIDAKF